MLLLLATRQKKENLIRKFIYCLATLGRLLKDPLYIFIQQQMKHLKLKIVIFNFELNYY